MMVKNRYYKYLIFIISLLILLSGCGEEKTDVNPPKVSITSPKPGDRVYGKLKVTISAKDQSGVKNVLLWIDNSTYSQAELTSSGWIAYWNTTGQEDSTIHVLSAEAEDYLGNMARSDSVRVMCINKGYPPVPVELYSEPVTTKHSVFLSWEKSIDLEFDKYILFRTVDSLWNSMDTIIEIDDRLTDSFEDKGYKTDSSMVTPWGLKEGETYYYKIAVVDTLGLKALSEPISATTQSLKPVILRNVSEIEKYSLRLHWSLQDNDYRYHIIYASKSGSVGNPSDSVGMTGGGNTSFKVNGLKSGTKYYFKVGSVDSSWNRIKSLALNATTLPFDTVHLQQPISGDISKYSVILRWTPTDMPDFTKYEIRRSRIAGVDTTDSLAGIIRVQSIDNFTDENLLPGTKYYYRIFTFDSLSNFSGSNEIAFTTKVIQKSVLSIGDVHKYFVELNWTESDEPDFSRYTLYRGNYQGFDSTTADMEVHFTSRSDTGYTDYSVNYNTAYYYKLYVTDQKGYSAVDSVDVTTLDFLPPELTGMTPINDNSFQLSWKLYEDNLTFTEYQLYRDTTESVDRAYSTLVTTISNRNTTTYLDQSPELIQYQPYYYRLYVRDIKGNISTGSNIAGNILNSAPVAVTMYTPDPSLITSSTIPLSWSPNQNADFWKFELYMSLLDQIEPDDGNSTLIATLGDTTNYTVHNLQPGIVYYFRIFVVDLGNEYTGSNVVYGVTKP